MKKLNNDIKSIGKILLKCHAVGVIQTAVKGYRMYEQLYHFADIEKVDGGDNIVGCFTSPEGKNKVLITTLTPSNDAVVTLYLTSKVSKVNVWNNGSSAEQTPIGGKLTFDIKAGEAIFVEF